MPVRCLLWWNVLSFLLITIVLSGFQKYTPNHPQGERVKIDLRGITALNGELLAAEPQYLVVLFNAVSSNSISQRHQPTIAFIHYEELVLLEVGSQLLHFKGLRPPELVHRRLNTYSRFPQGLDQFSLDEILKTCDQAEPIEIK